jgi:hypothetical protein
MAVYKIRSFQSCENLCGVALDYTQLPEHIVLEYSGLQQALCRYVLLNAVNHPLLSDPRFVISSLPQKFFFCVLSVTSILLGNICLFNRAPHLILR